VAQPDRGEHGEPGEDGDDEQVLGEAQPRLRADDWDVEVAVEQGAVALDDGRGEDDEPPEDREVREARDAPLEQLALAEHLDGDRAQAGAEAAGPVRFGGLAGAGDPVEGPHAPAGEGERRRRHGQAEHQSQEHHRSSVRSSSVTGRARCGGKSGLPRCPSWSGP
jgi:hypothetical protein